MPAVGSLIKIGNYDVPQKTEMALRAGIRFFIVRYPKRLVNNLTMMGFFDVNVSEDFNSAGNAGAYYRLPNGKRTGCHRRNRQDGSCDGCRERRLRDNRERQCRGDNSRRAGKAGGGGKVRRA